MKSYLAKFQPAPNQAGISIEKALPEKPSKPSKLGFAGFDGLPDSTFPEIQGQYLQPDGVANLLINPLPEKPSKPAKPSFDGFDGSWPETFQITNAIQVHHFAVTLSVRIIETRLAANHCPQCDGWLLADHPECGSWCGECRINWLPEEFVTMRTMIESWRERKQALLLTA